nr:uncharacterized protein LOC128696011 isoform X1 [Cherax quadricarinatus]
MFINRSVCEYRDEKICKNMEYELEILFLVRNTPGTSAAVNDSERAGTSHNPGSNDAHPVGAIENEPESAGCSASVGTSQHGGAAWNVDTSVTVNEDERASISHSLGSNVAHNSVGATVNEDEREGTSHDAPVNMNDEHPEIITYVQNFRGLQDCQISLFPCPRDCPVQELNPGPLFNVL